MKFSNDPERLLRLANAEDEEIFTCINDSVCSFDAMFGISVLPVEEKWGVYVDDMLIGTSKARFDADFAAQVLTKKIQAVLESRGSCTEEI